MEKDPVYAQPEWLQGRPLVPLLSLLAEEEEEGVRRRERGARQVRTEEQGEGRARSKASEQRERESLHGYVRVHFCLRKGGRIAREPSIPGGYSP